MGINLDKPYLWKNDIFQSVNLYNSWFMEFAPKVFRTTLLSTAKRVEETLVKTNYLKNFSVDTLRQYPEILPILRMSTYPPIARDRLIGLSQVSKNLVKNMEDLENPRFPSRMKQNKLNKELEKISDIILKMLDLNIFVWLADRRDPTEEEVIRASTIVADRLCGAIADSIIRNAQEKRQLEAIKLFLESKGYAYVSNCINYETLPQGTFSFHTNVPVYVADGQNEMINISVDVVITPLSAKGISTPIFLEAKSAGDFTNVNKRRKEEAIKMQQLRCTYGNNFSYVLFLCGYFDLGYLSYEAAEGIDWIWEHRIMDMNFLNI